MEKKLFKVNYEKENEFKPLGFVTRSMHVFADSKTEALAYVQDNAKGFIGFPHSHDTLEVAEEIEYETAYFEPDQKEKDKSNDRLLVGGQ